MTRKLFLNGQKYFWGADVPFVNNSPNNVAIKDKNDETFWDTENSEAKCDFGLDKRILIEIIGWKNIRNQLLLDLRQHNEHVKKTNKKERGEERHDAHTQPLIVETHPRDAPRSARVLHFDSIQA